MTAINLFYSVPFRKGTRVANLCNDRSHLIDFVEHLKRNDNLNPQDYTIVTGSQVIRPETCYDHVFKNHSHVYICIPLKGGKGGFGSLLRAIGAQIEKTTNRNACRDLSGRRLRDVKREEELKILMVLQDKLIEERKRRKKEKLERLKKKYSNDEQKEERKSMQELVELFDDDKYQERRLKIDDIVQAAVDKGIINARKRQIEASNSGEELSPVVKKGRVDQKEEVGDSDSCSVDAKSEDLTVSPGLRPRCDTVTNLKSSRSTVKKKNDIWLGIEDDDND